MAVSRSSLYADRGTPYAELMVEQCQSARIYNSTTRSELVECRTFEMVTCCMHTFHAVSILYKRITALELAQLDHDIPCKLLTRH